MGRNRFSRHLALIICSLLVLINYSLPLCPPVLAAGTAGSEIDYAVDLTAGDLITVTGTVCRPAGGDLRLYLPAAVAIVELAASGDAPVEVGIVFDPALAGRTGLSFTAPGETFSFVYRLRREIPGGAFGFAYPGDILAVPAEPGSEVRFSLRLPAGQTALAPTGEIGLSVGEMPLLWGELRWGEAEPAADAEAYGVRLYGEVGAAARSGRVGPAEFTAILRRVIAAHRAADGQDAVAAGFLAACRLDRMLAEATDNAKSLVEVLDTFAADPLRLPALTEVAAAARLLAGELYTDEWQELTGGTLDELLADDDGDGRPDWAVDRFGPAWAGDGGGKDMTGAIRVTVDGRPLRFDVPPLLAAGRVLVPFRAMFEAFGIKVGWDAVQNLITATQDGVTLKLRPDYPVAWVGDVPQRLDAPVRTTDGRSFVPLRFVAETLGCRVDWDEGAGTVTVGTDGGKCRIIVPAAAPSDFPDAAATGDKVAYLTFDDGPSPSVTPQILATLAQYDIKATFFVIGSNAEKYPALLQRIVTAGHAVGNHTYSHVYAELEASQEAFLASVSEAEEVIEAITGVRTVLFRAPGGTSRYPQLFRDGLGAALRFCGYTTFDWNVTCVDSAYPRLGAEQLLENVKYYSQGKKTAIILMHDAATHEETAKALPLIIEYLRGEGYTFDILRPDNPLGK